MRRPGQTRLEEASDIHLISFALAGALAAQLERQPAEQARPPLVLFNHDDAICAPIAQKLKLGGRVWNFYIKLSALQALMGTDLA